MICINQLFTFGLLASSLVMLVLVPFLNNNSFLSNPAMAQEYDKYGDSSYSQYPTDDKKYECQTGPFEGFFVSSVEFCKHVKFDKDDDRKDNRTGTQDGDGNGVGTNQCAGDVEACFQQFLSQTQFEQLSEALDSPTGVKVDILGSEITLTSFEDICSGPLNLSHHL